MSGFVPEAWYTSCFKISDDSFQSGLFLIIFSLENWRDFPASFYVKRFLDCILDALNIVFRGCGSCLNLGENVDISVRAGRQRDYVQAAGFELLLWARPLYQLRLQSLRGAF